MKVATPRVTTWRRVDRISDGQSTSYYELVSDSEQPHEQAPTVQGEGTPLVAEAVARLPKRPSDS